MGTSTDESLNRKYNRCMYFMDKAYIGALSAVETFIHFVHIDVSAMFAGAWSSICMLALAAAGVTISLCSYAWLISES